VFFSLLFRIGRVINPLQHKDFHPATGWASLHFVKMSLQMLELQGEKGGVEFIDENGGGPGVRLRAAAKR
jgi:hypothetical protein